MRLDLKPAAVSAAAAVLLLLIFDLTWPGHGIWLLVVGILLAITAGGLWYRDRLQTQAGPDAGHDGNPFSEVGAYGLSGTRVSTLTRERSGVPLSGVMATVAALAILLFIGGAIGSGDSTATEPLTTLKQDAVAIDRSGDSELQTPQVQPPSGHQTQQAQTTTTITAVTTTTSSDEPKADATAPSQSSEPVKPIVVAAPQPASAAEEVAEVEEIDPRALTAIEYTVEEGDTLYDIALRYDSTVEAIMDLNELDASSFIHPGDVLLIPQIESEGEES